uniref:Uncharacterized protein n=1 Tax=Arundo donax TaxID=35708 RepID=A0A0A9CHR9_ARUDO
MRFIRYALELIHPVPLLCTDGEALMIKILAGSSRYPT